MSAKTENLVVTSLSKLLQDEGYKGGDFDFYGKNFKQAEGEKKVVSEIRSDVMNVTKLFEQSFFNRYMLGYEDYTLSTLRRALALKKDNKSKFANAKQPIVRTFVDRLLKGIVKAKFGLKARAVNPENAAKVEAVQAAIEWCFTTSGAKKKIGKVAGSGMLNGNGYVKASFNTPEEKKKNVLNPEAREVIRFEKGYAKFDWVSEFDLFFDPLEKLRGDQSMVIMRSIKPLKSVLKVIEKMDSHISPEHLAYVMANPKPFVAKNYNEVRLIKYYEDVYYNMQGFNIDNAFKINFNNKKVEYIEIWTPDTLSICINGYLVADGKNPLGNRDYWHPYFSAHYTENPGVEISEGIGILLGDIQKGYDTLFNLLLDQARMTASPMIMLSHGQQLNRSDSDTKFNWEPWGLFVGGDPGSISFLTPPSVDQGTISILTNMLEMAQFNVAPATYSDFKTQSRSAQDSMLRFEGLSDTVSLFIDSMSSMLNEVAQAWLLDMQSKMPEIFELPIFDKAGLIKSWKKIKREDLEGQFIFEWVSESIRDINTLVEKSQLPEFINSISTFAMNDQGKSIIDKEKLLKYICDLYQVPDNVVLENKVVWDRASDDAIQQANIEQSVAAMQAEAQGPQEQTPDIPPQPEMDSQKMEGILNAAFN